MIAHGLTGGELYGADQSQGQFKPECCRLINYYITSSEYGRKFAASAAGIPIKNCLALGMPRTDNYINKTKGDGHTILATKRAYLYAPTFREPDEPSNFNLNLTWLDHELTNDEIFVIKNHMRGKTTLTKSYKHIIEISSSEPSNPYLYDCDVVITDYSSIIFDGYLLNKPAILFEKQTDYATYRGMYMQYPYEYSSKYATNEKELLNLLRSTNTLTQVELDVINKVANKCDGHSCERICNLINTLR